MSIVVKSDRPPVELYARRYMSRTEKLSRWIECGKVCAICGEAVAWEGRHVVWDHRVSLAMGGTNALENMEPHHAIDCAPLKTAADAQVRAKAKRNEARENGTRRPRKPIPGRSLTHPTLKRGFGGKVTPR